jgi:hypothetical protein
LRTFVQDYLHLQGKQHSGAVEIWLWACDRGMTQQIPPFDRSESGRDRPDRLDGLG